jgi:hypothetical protein
VRVQEAYDHWSATYDTDENLTRDLDQVTTATAFLQIGRNVLFSQRAGQVARALPALLLVGIQDEKPCSTLLVEQIGAQRDLAPQVGKQVADVQLFVRTDVAAVVKLAGVEIPPLNKSLGQHQGWAGEFGVWK